MPRAVPLVSLLLALGACAAPRCKHVVTTRVAAPDGSHDAVVYRTDCGVQDGASTGVAVLPHAADLPDLPTAVLSLARPVRVNPAWSSADTLRLSYPADTRVVTHMARTLDGVTVQLRPQSGDQPATSQ